MSNGTINPKDKGVLSSRNLTSIQIKISTRDKLQSFGVMGSTYDKVIKSLMDFAESKGMTKINS